MPHDAPLPPIPQCVGRWISGLLALIAVLTIIGAPDRAVAQDSGLGLSPLSGHAAIIAQGVVPLPAGDAVWRTVRTRAPLPADALFEERPLGFVLATAGPLLLVDQASGEQIRLGVGEAALVRAGAMQQRLSLLAQPVGYLSIELVALDAPPPPEGAIVLQPGQPFPAPTGLRDLDLLRDTLGSGESFTIPDTGAKNVILITDGAANVARPDGAPVVLLAGEAASFSGELVVAPAASGDAEGDIASFVVGMIGPEVPPPALPAEATATIPAGTSVTPETTTAAGVGSITVQVYTCPPGMDASTLNAAVCAPAVEEFDVTLSGGDLLSPLTIGDATAAVDAFTWDELPFGDYVIAEAVLPRGFTTYALSARDASGSPEAGFRVTLGESEPALQVRIYNFAPA